MGWRTGTSLLYYDLSQLNNRASLRNITHTFAVVFESSLLPFPPRTLAWPPGAPHTMAWPVRRSGQQVDVM
jgi:hypothetical protein